MSLVFFFKPIYRPHRAVQIPAAPLGKKEGYKKRLKRVLANATKTTLNTAEKLVQTLKEQERIANELQLEAFEQWQAQKGELDRRWQEYKLEQEKIRQAQLHSIAEMEQQYQRYLEKQKKERQELIKERERRNWLIAAALDLI
jgi:hypothetical protein